MAYTIGKIIENMNKKQIKSVRSQLFDINRILNSMFKANVEHVFLNV